MKLQILAMLWPYCEDRGVKRLEEQPKAPFMVHLVHSPHPTEECLPQEHLSLKCSVPSVYASSGTPHRDPWDPLDRGACRAEAAEGWCWCCLNALLAVGEWGVGHVVSSLPCTYFALWERRGTMLSIWWQETFYLMLFLVNLISSYLEPFLTSATLWCAGLGRPKSYNKCWMNLFYILRFDRLFEVSIKQIFVLPFRVICFH